MRILLTLALLMILPPVMKTAQAATERYEFDKAHTQILFFVNHLGFSMSQGEFHKYDGSVEFDQENPENSKVDVTIYTDSIDMDDEKWDAHMKNADFFNIGEYPKMTFKGTKVEVTGDNTANITGKLTILDTTNDVVLNTTFNKAGVHPFSKRYVAGFSATANIKRSEFGMNYGIPGVGDDVEIRLEVEAMRLDGDKTE